VSIAKPRPDSIETVVAMISDITSAPVNKDIEKASAIATPRIAACAVASSK